MNIREAKEVIRAAEAADDTVILEGPHGIGKSDIVRQVCNEDDYHLEILFLSHQEVGDLIGIPHTIKIDGVDVTTWSVPIWLNRMREASAAGKKCMLFLDELNRAPLDVRQSAMQLVLERHIHEHALPDLDGRRTCVVAAVNPAGDYQVDELDPALMDRFLFAAVEADASEWLRWARSSGVNGAVCDFIASFPDLIHWTASDGGVGATPRSWTKLASYIDNINDIPEEIIFHVLKGKVGVELASQFYSFYKDSSGVLTLEDVKGMISEGLSDDLDVKGVGAYLKPKLVSQESVRLLDLASGMRKECIESGDYFNLLALLYSFHVEIAISALRDFREKDLDNYRTFSDLDEELTGRSLFRDIISLSREGK